MILSTGFALLALQPAEAAAPPPPTDEIVVTGTRAAGEETQRAPLGSRIGRRKEVDPRGFVSQIASDTGVAGLSPTSGLDPFTGGARKITVKSCKADDARLSLAALCDLAAIQRKIEEGDDAGALVAIHRLGERGDVTPLDRFFAHRFHYQIAQAARDDTGRRDAIEAMLETGAMARPDELAARRTLAAMALARGDDDAAIVELERVTAIAPADVRSHANLGALYARNGMPGKARERMADAVKLTAAAGQPVPDAWRDYLAPPR